MEQPKRDGRRKWVKLWTQSWLEGPISEESLAVRAIFAGLLVLAGDSRYAAEGRICVTPTIGLTNDQIARLLKVDVRTWAKHKDRLIDIEHICIDENGVITINEWKKYQGDYIRVQEHRARKVEENVTNETQDETDRSKKKEVRRKNEKLLLEGTNVPSLSETKVSSHDLMAYWNSKGNLTQCRSWSQARQKKLRARCKDKDFIRYWREAIDAISANPYCTGQGSSSWVANIGWFLSHDKHGELNWAKHWEKGVTQEVKAELSREKIRKREQEILEQAERERAEREAELSPQAKAMVERLANEKDAGRYTD